MVMIIYVGKTISNTRAHRFDDDGVYWRVRYLLPHGFVLYPRKVCVVHVIVHGGSAEEAQSLIGERRGEEVNLWARLREN